MRHELTYRVGAVSWFISNTEKEHWTTAKWIFRYVRGSSKLCLCFNNDKSILVGYIDADMAIDMDSRKSISGYLVTFLQGSHFLIIKIAKVCFPT